MAVSGTAPELPSTNLSVRFFPFSEQTPTTSSGHNRIEIIVSQNHLQGISTALNQFIYNINATGVFSKNKIASHH